MQNSRSDTISGTVSAGGLSSEYRLLREDGFHHVIRAENIANKFFKIFFIGNKRKNGRLGIISSKKFLPRAIDRNRVKRIVRETFRQHNIKASKLDVVVMMKLAYVRTPNITIKNDSLVALLSQVESKCANL
ncbi:MAG: ribonuclease P protein component [Gallionella sp.]